MGYLLIYGRPANHHEAEVIEPEELRDKIKESLRKTLVAYGDRSHPIRGESEIQDSVQDYAG